MMTSTKQFDALESIIVDIIKRMEVVEFTADRLSDIPTHTINSVYNLMKAAFDLYADIQEWRERRENSTTATVVRIADYIGKNTTAQQE